MIKTANPELDAERYYNEGEAHLKKLPKCDECGEPIQDEWCYVTEDGTFCCDCLLRKYRVDTDTFIEGGY